MEQKNGKGWRKPMKDQKRGGKQPEIWGGEREWTETAMGGKFGWDEGPEEQTECVKFEAEGGILA